jgi:hypothetical protein
MVCTEHTKGSEIVLDVPDGTARWCGSCGSLCGPFGNTVSVGVRYVHGLRRMYHRIGNQFGRIWWNSQVTWVMSNLILVYLETALLSVDDRCTVCAKRTIGPRMILDTPDGSPRWRGSCWFLFRSV